MLNVFLGRGIFGVLPVSYLNPATAEPERLCGELQKNGCDGTVLFYCNPISGQDMKFTVKKQNRELNKQDKLWDAFVSYMDSIYFPGCC